MVPGVNFVPESYFSENFLIKVVFKNIINEFLKQNTKIKIVSLENFENKRFAVAPGTIIQHRNSIYSVMSRIEVIIMMG